MWLTFLATSIHENHINCGENFVFNMCSIWGFILINLILCYDEFHMCSICVSICDQFEGSTVAFDLNLICLYKCYDQFPRVFSSFRWWFYAALVMLFCYCFSPVIMPLFLSVSISVGLGAVPNQEQITYEHASKEFTISKHYFPVSSSLA